MRRTRSDLLGVIPAMTEWAVKPGDKLRVFSPNGDPREASTDLSQAYIVPDPFVLQPFYFKGFIATARLSNAEILRLENNLDTKISENLISEINRSIEDFVCTVALQRRLATWKEIEIHLQNILRTCETVIVSAQNLVQMTDPKVLDNSVSLGALSADQLVKKMLMDKLCPDNFVLKVNLDSLIAPCMLALEEIQSKIKRGRKPETIFRLFLGRIVRAMKEDGFEVKVPSNDNVFDKKHSTFVFLNSVLDICVEKGKAAIFASDLEHAEKEEASRSISQYRKSSRAIVHYFRDGSFE